MLDFQLKRKKLVSQFSLTVVEFQSHTFETTKCIAPYKCKQFVYVIVVCVFRLCLSLPNCCFFTSPSLFVILMLLLYFCLFVDRVNNNFWSFYHFNNMISIFVTIFTYNIGHYNPSVGIIDLVSHTTRMAVPTV